ncbi:unnamed protein product [Adineta ricciae]|uniref:G-protein coupled receptors family 1 profile domain-containing protein n=1 Tax=Adineta ricciae TaxID=249248 RepID=A0A815JHP6_ADIRI|nr:unnamed protein product [Adineta ricciae]CAF1468195.1 unnamed protein product [Adineta ricciae]
MNTTTATPSFASYNLNNEIKRISTYILPITILTTIISNIINIIILSRRTLRSSPCPHYFLALAISSLIYTTISPVSLFITYEFNIVLSNTPFGCPFQPFIIYASSLFVVLMLVCASLDRVFASSSTASYRNLSHIRIAQRSIIVITILVLIYLSPVLIIFQWDYIVNRCIQSSSPIIIVFLSTRVILYYILSPLIMIIFGLLTIHNIQSQLRRVTLMNQGGFAHRRTENQLVRMLVVQVAAYVFFSIPAAVTYILTTFVPSLNTTFINNIRTITIVWQQGTYVFATFLYILSGSVYRKELKKLFKCRNYLGQPLRLITARLRT